MLALEVKSYDIVIVVGVFSGSVTVYVTFAVLDPGSVVTEFALRVILGF